MGTIQIFALNRAKGDMRLAFDTSNPADREEAAKVVADLVQKGYAVFAHSAEGDVQVEKFDPEVGEYVVKGSTKAAKGGKRVKAAEATAVPPMAGG